MVESDVFVKIYTQPMQATRWLRQYAGQRPIFACVLGFTETGLIPGISAAGATPKDRQYTAIADAEFLWNGPQSEPTFPLPPLHVGASPVLISRAVIAAQAIPLYLFNAGLPHAPAVPAIDLGGNPAKCVSTGAALSRPVVEQLFQQGLLWGEKLAAQASHSYLILGECVVGGTTTALAVLTGLGIAAAGKVNSSHPVCNHQQKWELVQMGLNRLMQQRQSVVNQSEIATVKDKTSYLVSQPLNPFDLVMAVGDPMQIVVAGMAIAASRACGVMLAGGTQMLAVAALAQAIAHSQSIDWNPAQIVVGTTRWVAEDQSGDTIGLAKIVNAPLLATGLDFSNSRHPELRTYEQGFVKEGVGAGGCAIAAALYQNWGQAELLVAIDNLASFYQQICTQTAFAEALQQQH